LIVIASTTGAALGFTPNDETRYTVGSRFSVKKADEDDTTVFVLSGMENIFQDNKITLPFLSRA